MVYPIQRRGKWGFINERLEMVLGADLEYANPVLGGFAAFGANGRSGFVDAEGRIVCPPRFLDVGYFHAGHCWFKDERGFGLIDRHFKPLFHLRAGRPFESREGVLMFKAANATYAYARANGRVFLRGNLACQNYSEGLLAFQARVPGHYGYRNLEGTWSIKPQFDAATEFSEGLAAVGRKEGDEYLVGYIDKGGALRLPYRYRAILALAQFQSGRALVWQTIKRRELAGYIEPGGEFAIAAQFDSAAPFRGEVAAVEKKGKWGLIDRAGEWLCRPKFDFVGQNVDRPLIWAGCGRTVGYYTREGRLAAKSEPQ